jgi:hypothetical protein
MPKKTKHNITPAAALRVCAAGVLRELRPEIPRSDLAELVDTFANRYGDSLIDHIEGLLIATSAAEAMVQARLHTLLKRRSGRP